MMFYTTSLKTQHAKPDYDQGLLWVTLLLLGFGVPLMDFVAQREMLTEWALKKGPQGIETYQQAKNARSIDGLPAPGLDQE